MLALLRLATGVGAAANWIVIFVFTVVAVFVACLGIAMYATLRAFDPDQQEIRYKVFCQTSCGASAGGGAGDRVGRLYSPTEARPSALRLERAGGTDDPVASGRT